MQGVSGMDNKQTEQALRDYGTSILHLAYSYLHSRADAEDVLQDTMVQYLRSAPVFTEERQRKAWLYKVAANLCKNRLSTSWSRTSALPEDFPSDGIPEESIGLLQAVSALPPQYREVVHLFYYEDATTAEIAKMLGKPEATVRSLLFRARKTLKRELEA
jgi:RNA polymerase sigma factor (sigma-70 family)